MVRKIINWTVVLGLFVVMDAGISFANGSPQWITGEVVSIVENQREGLISLKLPSGEIASITSGPGLLKGVQTGDIVTVQVIEGRAEIIQVAESKAPPTPVPHKKDSGVQWVPGELVSIQEGPTESLLSIKMSDGTVFNVAASNDKIQGVKVGDYVIAKVFQGWAESVSKKKE